MSRERIVLIVTGTALIVLVVAIAAFSLGVYVGASGWTAGAPAVDGPGQRPAAAAPGGQPGRPAGDVPLPEQPGQVPGAAAPPGPQPQLIGRVRSLSGDMVTLDTPQGPRLFQLGPDVQISRVAEDQAELPASLQQVQPGRRLAVFGQFASDGAGRLVAHRLLLLPQAQP